MNVESFENAFEVLQVRQQHK